MPIDIIGQLSANVLVGMVLALIATVARPTIRQIAIQLGLEKPSTPESYSKRLASLLESLGKASSEVDSVLAEVAQIAKDRETTVRKLEGDLEKLSEREQQLQKRIQDLQNVPVPVAEYFAALVAQGEKRSARRDYILFGAGFLLSTVTAVILRALGVV